jgi:hypothetical protein
MKVNYMLHDKGYGGTRYDRLSKSTHLIEEKDRKTVSFDKSM